MNFLHPSSVRLHPCPVVGLGRLELPTSRLSGVRSNHLSYRPSLGPLVRPYPALSQRPKTHPLPEGSGVGLSKPNSETGKDFGRAPRAPCVSRRVLFDRYHLPPLRGRVAFFLRKEVIQPLLPERLPCYDFTPITVHTLVRCPPCGLAHALLVQTTLMV